MKNSYWTLEKKKSLIDFVKQGCSLVELHEKFPVKSTMSIIFAVRAVSSLALPDTKNATAKEKIKDQSLTKREAFPDSNRLWEDWDCQRLKTYFLQQMNIEDIYLNLGRTYTAIFKQMEVMYPKNQDRQKLYEKVAFYVRFKPLNNECLSDAKPNNTEPKKVEEPLIENSIQKVIVEVAAKEIVPQPIKKASNKSEMSSSYDVIFDNIESRILLELGHARWSIKIAVAWITNNTIGKVIMSKLEEGLDVAVILNKDKINCGQCSIDFEHMCTQGLSLHWVTNLKESLMHEKFCIIDNECVIEGTYNWTNKAEQKNDEHIIIIKNNDELINTFNERFNYLQKKYPSLDVEVSQEWLEKNKALKMSYMEYLLQLRQKKEQKVKSTSKKTRKRISLEPTNIWKEYYSRPWTTDDEALLLHYYYKEGLQIKTLSRILKRTDSELKRRLEDLKNEVMLLGLSRKK